MKAQIQGQIRPGSVDLTLHPLAVADYAGAE